MARDAERRQDRDPPGPCFSRRPLRRALVPRRQRRDRRQTGGGDDAGLFTPGDAGPNPERPMQTNNAGNLKVIATVDTGGVPLTAEAHLYATVQRFVDAPIR
uniref:hypothetical protein n=1 Tax=Paracoccus yeei TaxID=147645 RepID=UPI0021E0B3CA|nr:hypothetical protein [Paracoccus yeei]